MRLSTSHVPNAKVPSSKHGIGDEAQIKLVRQRGSNGLSKSEVLLLSHQQTKTTEDYLLCNNLFWGHPRHNLHNFIAGPIMLACTSRKLPTHRGISDDEMSFTSTWGLKW